MKLLVITATATEPSFVALQAFLDQIGIPHDNVILSTGPIPGGLPPLNDAVKGFYQGIILASGNLGICNATGACQSALSDAGWAALDTYAINYQVRTLSYYTFPQPRFGLSLVRGVDTTATPGALTFLPGAASIFSYLNTSTPVTVSNAWTYLAAPLAAAGEITTPIMSMSGSTVAVLHKKPDGREYLALTFDNSPYLMHSLLLNYGLFNWVTKGVFLGARKTYLSPQVDDIFIPNELYDERTTGCKPPGFLVDPTVDLSAQCPTNRITGADLTGLALWQKNLQAVPQTRDFKVTMAFNGLGATEEGDSDDSDTLVTDTKTNALSFYWVSHTFDHKNLDCFDPVPNSGVCRQANSAEATAEITRNSAVAASLALPFDARGMVTPEISGLNNPAFLQAAVSNGIRYLIIDASTLTANPPPANTGIRNASQPSILMVPRRPTSIFYNTTTSVAGAAGSLTDEYNYFYGPSGIFRLGGTSGPPFFSINQTYSQIIDRESDAMLMAMLRYEAFPFMFHQSNLARYDGVRSLFTDVIGQTLSKFTRMSKLPVSSLSQSGIGDLLSQRMDYNASGVRGTLYPAKSVSGLSPGDAVATVGYITLTTVKAATIPITGFCSSRCETYGSQRIQYVQMPAGGTTTLYPSGGSNLNPF